MSYFMLAVLPAILFGFLIGAGFGYSQREKDEKKENLKKSIDRF